MLLEYCIIKYFRELRNIFSWYNQNRFKSTEFIIHFEFWMLKISCILLHWMRYFQKKFHLKIQNKFYLFHAMLILDCIIEDHQMQEINRYFFGSKNATRPFRLAKICTHEFRTITGNWQQLFRVEDVTLPFIRENK